MNEYCEFCAALNVYKFLAEKDNSKEFEKRQTVALVNGSYKKGRKTIRGRITNYGCKGRGYELNFCPSCGRKITK